MSTLSKIVNQAIKKHENASAYTVLKNQAGSRFLVTLEYSGMRVTSTYANYAEVKQECDRIHQQRGEVPRVSCSRMSELLASRIK